MRACPGTPSVGPAMLAVGETFSMFNCTVPVSVAPSRSLTRLGDVIQAVERAIEAQAFYPIESQMNCSGCPFFKPCKQWQGSPGRKDGSLETEEKGVLARC